MFEGDQLIMVFIVRWTNWVFLGQEEVSSPGRMFRSFFIGLVNYWEKTQYLNPNVWFHSMFPYPLILLTSDKALGLGIFYCIISKKVSNLNVDVLEILISEDDSFNQKFPFTTVIISPLPPPP